MRAAILICLTALFVPTARAHDPYEITSVVYLQSNRIEIFVEMEFPTGMTLAGQKPTRDVVVLSQFEATLPQLRKLAGGFYDFTAGNHVVPALTTNVELGVEDHIRFHVEYATTQHRPLRFVAQGLGGDADQNPYGVSLTVLDMVNQKVLGQTTLFAGSAPAEFPPRNQEPPEPVTPPTVTNTPTPVTVLTSLPNQPVVLPTNNSSVPPGKSWLSLLVILAGLTGLIVFFILRRRA